MVRQGVSAGRYRFSEHGAPSERGLQGMYVLKDGAGCRVYRPTWQGTRTVIRILPIRDPEDPSRWDPFRIGDGPRDVGDWIRRYDMAMGIGQPGITFITKDPRDHSIDDQQLPIWMLNRYIPAAVKAGQAPPSWNPMVFGQGRSAPINPPKDGYLVQCILMEHKSKPQNPPLGCRPEDSPIVMLLSQSAGEALLNKIAEVDETTGQYKWRDLIDLNGGMFVQLQQAGTGGAGVGPAVPIGTAPASTGGFENNNRYEVTFLENYHGIPAAIPHLADVIARKSRNWDDIVHIMTVEEQVRKLSRCGIPATAIVYALGEMYGDFIPEDVLEQARAQTQAPQAYALPGTNQMMPGTNPMMPPAGRSVQDPSMPAPGTGSPMSRPGPIAPATPAVPGPGPLPGQQTLPGMGVATPTAAPTPAPVMGMGMGMGMGASAGNPMTPSPGLPAAQVTSPAPTPAQEGFDQPTTASVDRTMSTMAALERARLRATSRSVS